jgi:hypothetical protein
MPIVSAQKKTIRRQVIKLRQVFEIHRLVNRKIVKFIEHETECTFKAEDIQFIFWRQEDNIKQFSNLADGSFDGAVLVVSSDRCGSKIKADLVFLVQRPLHVNPGVLHLLARLQQLRALVRQQLQGVAVSGGEPDVCHDEGVGAVRGHDVDGDGPRCRTFKQRAPDLDGAAVVMLTLGGVGPEQVHLHDGEGGGDAQPLLGDLPHLHLDEPGLGLLTEGARFANLLRQSSPPPTT